MPESQFRRLTHRISTTALLMSAALLLFLRPLALPGLRVFLRLAKHIAAAFSRVTSFLGLLSTLLGVLTRSPMVFLAGIVSYIVSTGYYRRLPASPPFESEINACEADSDHTGSGTQHPTTTPGIHRDVCFATIARESAEPRDLLCDIWLPPDCAGRSGTVFIYFHGGAWHSLDKGLLTGPIFRRLCADGHCVMDVAYRLHPETDMRGMLGDVQRAIAWMKNDKNPYNIQPKHIILMGSSAGGHLALMHAYTVGQPGWPVPELSDADLHVDGVVAFYPPVDLRAYLEYSPSGLAPSLLGGTPDEVPEAYARYSPTNHVHALCPPTLLLQGSHDYVVPVEPVRELNHKLGAVGVDSDYIEYPANEHGFDLFLPNISPSAKSAMHHVQHFAHKITQLTLDKVSPES